jgi:hypothetical protein
MAFRTRLALLAVLVVVGCAAGSALAQQAPTNAPTPPGGTVLPPDPSAAAHSKVVALVALSSAAAEACARDYPTLAPQLTAAESAWQARNAKYVEMAKQDPNYETFKARLLASRPTNTPIPQSQCNDTIHALGDTKTDIDSINARANGQ